MNNSDSIFLPDNEVKLRYSEQGWRRTLLSRIEELLLRIPAALEIIKDSKIGNEFQEISPVDKDEVMTSLRDTFAQMTECLHELRKFEAYASLLDYNGTQDAEMIASTLESLVSE